MQEGSTDKMATAQEGLGAALGSDFLVGFSRCGGRRTSEAPFDSVICEPSIATKRIKLGLQHGRQRFLVGCYNWLVVFCCWTCGFLLCLFLGVLPA